MHLGYNALSLRKLSRGILLNSEWFKVAIHPSCLRRKMSKKYYIKRQWLSS